MIHIKKDNNEKGLALVVVLMVLVVFAVLTTALIGLSVNNSKLNHNERDDQSTYYIAEAGVTTKIAEVKKIIDDNAEMLKKKKTKEDFYKSIDIILKPIIEDSNFELSSARMDFKESFGNPVKVTTKVEKVIENGSRDGDYIIKSKGQIHDKTRVLQLAFQIPFSADMIDTKPNSPGENPSAPSINAPDGTAVYVKNNIVMTAGALIEGSIGTNKIGGNTISLSGGAFVNGDVFVPAGSEEEAFNNDHYITIAKPTGIKNEISMELPDFPSFPTYPFPPNSIIASGNNKKEVIKDGSLYVDNWLTNNYTLKLDDNISLSKLKIDQNNILTIDVGSTDKIIILDNLDVLNGHINIIGSGKLTFVVKQDIVLGSGSTINNGGSLDKFGIYLERSSNPHKPKEVTLSGNQKIYGSLYAEDANITINAGGGFQGNIITGGKNVLITGGGSSHSSLILAPNADVKLTGGGTVKGTIYANSLYMNGGTKVNYGVSTVVTGPFAPGSEDGNEDENEVPQEPSNPLGRPTVILDKTTELTSSDY